MTSILYLLDTDPKRTQEIIETANNKKLHIEVVKNIPDLYISLENKGPEAIFIAYHSIHNSNETYRFAKKYYTIVYGQNIDSDSRVDLYNKGISRILDWETGKSTLLIQFYQNYVFRQTELKPAIQRYITYGDTNEIYLREILLNAILEKKNFSFKFNDGEKSSKLRIYNGEIVEVAYPGKTDLESVLCILQAQSGQFRMKSYTKPEEFAFFSPSSLGLIIEANFQLNMVNEYLKNFKIKNPIFQKSDQFKKNLLSSDEKKFISLVDELKEFRKFLEGSPFGRLKTLRLFEKLYQSGAISLNLDKSELLYLNPEDCKFIRDRLYDQGQIQGRLLVLGYPDSGKSELIKTLARVQQTEIKTIQSLEFTTIKLDKELLLTVFGISIDLYFQPVMKKLSANMLACFFIIDSRNREDVEYTKYLIDQILNNYFVPLVFAVTNITGDVQKVIFEMKILYEIPSKFDVIALNPDDFQQIKQLFYHLKDNKTV